MSTDRSAVVWTRLNNIPRKMGRLYVTDKECRFTYDDQYLEVTNGGAAFQENSSYILSRFNDYRRSLKGTHSAFGFTWKDKFIDWGARAQSHPGNLADGAHPNEAGENWIGNQLHSKVGFCPDPD